MKKKLPLLQVTSGVQSPFCLWHFFCMLTISDFFFSNPAATIDQTLKKYGNFFFFSTKTHPFMAIKNKTIVKVERFHHWSSLTKMMLLPHSAEQTTVFKYYLNVRLRLHGNVSGFFQSSFWNSSIKKRKRSSCTLVHRKHQKNCSTHGRPVVGGVI